MNEELKIIIKAVTDEAKKNIASVKDELEEVKEESKQTGITVDKALRGFAKGAAIAIGAITAVTGAMVALTKSSLEFQKAQAKLVSSFQTVGASTEQANKTYKELFRFLGDTDRATEAAQSLALITQSEKELAEWTNILQGAYALMGDKLPTEGLAEAANETIKTATVTGNLADALNWLGISEDAVNEQLATLTSQADRELYLRNLLNNAYSGASAIYERNNASMLAYQESQARVNIALAEATKYVIPLLTQFNNLAVALLQLLKPAFEVVSSVIIVFVQWIVAAIEYIGAFFGLFGNEGVKATQSVAQSVQEVQNNVSSLTSGTSGLKDSFNKAADAAKELKKQTMGFDELNVVQDTTASSASGGSGGGASGGGISIPSINDMDLSFPALEEASANLEAVREKVEAVMVLVGIVAGTLLLWKIADFITELTSAYKIINNINAAGLVSHKIFVESAEAFIGKIKGVLKLIGALTLIIGGAIAVVKGFVSAWTDGVDWQNLLTVLVGLGLVIGGLAIQFGGVGAVIGVVISGVVLLVMGIKDLIDNGYSLVSALTAIGGAVLLLSTLANPIPAIIAAIVGAFYILYNECEVFREFINNLWNTIVDGFKAFIKTLEPLWKSMKNAWDAIAEFFVTLWEEVIVPVFEWAWNAIKTAWEACKPFFEWLWEAIKVIFTPVELVLGGFFTGAWEVIKLVWGTAISYFSAIFDTIAGVFRAFTAILKGDWDGAWAHIKGIANTWKGFFQGVWDGIKKVFSTVGSFFKNTFEGAWSGVKKVFTTGGKVFEGIKEGIANVFTVIVNGIIKGINLIIAAPFKTINGILNKIRAIEFLNISPFKKLWKKDLLPVPEIPLLATGGVVNSATMAVIGERGKEAVLPLENNTGWMDTLAERLATKSGTPSKIVLMVDGKELGYATIGSINDITRQTGKLQLNVM